MPSVVQFGPTMTNLPITPEEFATLMAPLGPFAPGHQIAVAVSGGPDSLALALLLRRWGNPTAFIIDHALRPDSAEEARQAAQTLATLGIPSRTTRLALPKGPDLGARARTARYGALFTLCTEAGLADLALGHHARDQDETILLRQRSGSGPTGLSGMAALAWHNPARLLRPFLSVSPARLRATLRHAGLRWAEDPGNTDPATARGALRASPIPPQPSTGPARHAAEQALAAELAASVTLHEAGFARLHAPLSPPAWSALLWTLSGRPYPPSRPAVERLAREGQGTLHGILVRNGIAVREPAATAPPVAAEAGSTWDSRFLLLESIPDATLGALGPDAPNFRRHTPWPSVVLRTLPAIRARGKLLAVPHLAYPDTETCRSLRVAFRPPHPLRGAPFRP